jgi:alanyl-tRNA synthetase
MAEKFDMTKEYELQFFQERKYDRRQCKSCGAWFWTLDSAQETCQDSPCGEYHFIHNPIINKKFTMDEMREHYLDFFEKRGHARVDRYPVVARWRDDVFLVNASIYDFQPHVTSGQVPPPANPLTISQPCIRMTDLDSVGRTGKHTSCFEMMAHHVFNSQDKPIYWKNRTVELCHELLTQTLGVANEAITYKEHPWIGGGNAGPSLEVIVGGLELATLVFMNLKQDRAGGLLLEGKTYSPLPLNVVDTGYGLERFVWMSQGTSTIYESIYPEVVNLLLDAASLDYDPNDAFHKKIMGEYAKLAGKMDLGSQKDMSELTGIIVSELGKRGVEIDASEFNRLIRPVQDIYTVADHTRTIALMLSDGIVPSNVKAGYLVRLVIRRTIRLLEDLKLDIGLKELVAKHMQLFGKIYDTSTVDIVSDMLDLEEEKYAQTLSKGEKMVRDVLKKEGGEMPLDNLIELYDTHGIHYSLIKKIAASMGHEIKIPDNFNTILAEMHETPDEVKAEGGEVEALPVAPTKLLYYEQPNARGCTAKVLYSKEGKVVLDQTMFYPEGGGQPADGGHLEVGGQMVKVKDVQKRGDAIVHLVEGGIGIAEGQEVRCIIDWDVRMSHSRHHSGTHLILGACRRVLGEHIWQSGSQNTEEFSRVDISHYKPISRNEVHEIERIANEAVLADIPIEKTWLDRDEAEKKYGFRLYQGGVPMTKRIRVVNVPGFDVEACGGTHCSKTSEVGMLKIKRVERIQDGVERIVFSAGIHALKHTQETDTILWQTGDILRVPTDQIPATAQRFFEEWKSLKKRVEKLGKFEAMSITDELKDKAFEQYNNRMLICKKVDVDAKTLTQVARDMQSMPTTVCILAAPLSEGFTFIIARSEDLDIDTSAIMKAVMDKVGGGGGGKPDFAQGRGKDLAQIDDAIDFAKELIKQKL